MTSHGAVSAVIEIPFSFATGASCCTTEQASSSSFCGVFSSTEPPSSSWLSLKISSISAKSRCDSLQIRSAKRGMSSGFAKPSRISSAKPEIEVSGVRSSCDTFAVNSRRRRSLSSRSVTSSRSSTAPVSVSPS